MLADRAPGAAGRARPAAGLGGALGLLDESWRTLRGRAEAGGLGIDSGFATQEVYGWVRTQPAGRVFALKGVERGAALVGLPTWSMLPRRQAAASWRQGAHVATGLAKLELFNHLRLPAPVDGEPFPPGYVDLPKVDTEYLKQLCAEQLVTRRDKRGYAGASGRRPASATRRSTATSMPGPPPQSSASTVGVSRRGPSTPRRVRSARHHRR